MSIHYGVSRYTYDTIKKRTLNYQIFFDNLHIFQDTFPVSLNNGWPHRRLFCKGHHPDGGFQILTHRFDEDDHLRSPLTLRLKFRACMSDGTVQLIDLADIDYFGADIGKNETTFFLEKRFKFKDIKKVGTMDIWAFDIVFRQLTGDSAYDNESCMDIAVDY